MARINDYIGPSDDPAYTDASGCVYSDEDAFSVISKEPYRISPVSPFRVAAMVRRKTLQSWTFRHAGYKWRHASQAFRDFCDSEAYPSDDGFQKFYRAGFNRDFLIQWSRAESALSFIPFSSTGCFLNGQDVIFLPGFEVGEIIRRPTNVSFFNFLKSSFFSSEFDNPAPGVISFGYCLSSDFSVPPALGDWSFFPGPNVSRLIPLSTPVSGKYLWFKISFSRPADDLLLPMMVSKPFFSADGWFW